MRNLVVPILLSVLPALQGQDPYRKPAPEILKVLDAPLPPA